MERNSISESLHILIEIEESSGRLERMEDYFWEVERLGPVMMLGKGGGWGFTESAALTNEGRGVPGFSVITPPVRQSLANWLKGVGQRWWWTR